MSDKRFGYGETDLFEWVEDNGEMISTKECVNKLNEQQATISRLKEENEQLRNQNKKLKWDLEKTREDLNYFATLKVTAMKGSEPK